MSEEEKSVAEEIFYCPCCGEMIKSKGPPPIFCPYCEKNLDLTNSCFNLAHASGLFADD